MNSKSKWTRLLAFVIAFIMVMSTASVALANIGTQKAAADGKPGAQAAKLQTETFYNVTFKVNGADYDVSEVAAGGKVSEPTPPDRPVGMNSFLGWYTKAQTGDPSASDVPFDFEGTAITSDLTLYAWFSAKHLVKFLDVDGKVVHSVLVTRNATVSNPGDLGIDLPENKIFKGWALQGQSSAYNFSASVSANLTLVPLLNDAYYVYFVSKGSAVAPQFVEKGQKVPKPSDPTRLGYTFRGWSTVDSDTGATYNFNSQTITGTTVLYGTWNTTNVDYTVVYWMEKAGIAGDAGTDPNNYAYVRSETKKAAAGSMVSGDGIQGSLSSIDYAYYSHGDENVVIAGNKTSVLNVYFKRTVYTIFFNLNRTNARMTIGDNTYKGSEYSISAKYEEDIGNRWPTAPNATFTGIGSDKFQLWETAGGSLWLSKRWKLTSDMIPSSGTRTLTARYQSNMVLKSVEYWIEQYPGQTGTAVLKGNGRYYVMSTDYSQEFYDLQSNNFSAKDIEGATHQSSMNETKTPGNGTGVTTTYIFYYNRDRYTLSFNTQGGAPISAVSNLLYNTELAGHDPGTPTRSGGYTFKGWYLESECKTPFTFVGARMPDHNLTLFAKWESNNFTAFFYDRVGGAELSGLRQGVAQGKSVIAPTGEEAFVQGRYYEGYGVFQGWSWYLPGSGGKMFLPYSWETPVTEDVKLYAVWKTDGFKVTYTADSGRGTPPVDNTPYSYGVLAMAAGRGSLQASYYSGGTWTFIGWKLNGVTYYPGNTFTVTGDMTLSAYYSKSIKTLRFHANTGTGSATFDWTVERNADVNLTGASFTREGYTLAGWSKSSGNNSVEYALDGTYKTANDSNRENLYAVWKVGVTFLPGEGGTLAGTTVFPNITPGTPWSNAGITVPTTTPNDGYKFLGWSVDGATIIANFPANINSNLVYTAMWEELPPVVEKYYTVNYLVDRDGDGAYNGSDETLTPQTFSIKTDTDTFPAVNGGVAVDGYDFHGWFKDTTLTDALSEGLFATDPADDIVIPAEPGAAQITKQYYTLTLTGRLEQRFHDVENYEITYEVTGAMEGLSGTYASSEDHVTHAQALPVVKTGYSITGWTIGSNTYLPDGLELPWVKPVPTSVSETPDHDDEDGKKSFTRVYDYKLAATAEIAENRTDTTEYNVTYSVAGTYTDPSNGATLTPGNVPGAYKDEDIPAALGSNPTMKGHNFNGWKQTNKPGNPNIAVSGVGDIQWVVTSRVDEDTANNTRVYVTVYTAVLEGSFTIKTAQKDYYSLTYSGTPADIELAGEENWPANISNEWRVTAPVLAGKPTKAGYTFKGWSLAEGGVEIGSIPWGDPHSIEVVYESDTFVTKNTYSKTVYGRFEKNIHKESEYAITYKAEGYTAGLVNSSYITGVTVTDGLTTAQALPGVKAGYKITGWTITGGSIDPQTVESGASFNWGTPDVIVSDTPTHAEGGKLYFVETSTYTLTAVATIEEDRGEAVEEYTLLYVVDTGMYLNPVTGVKDIPMGNPPQDVLKGAKPSSLAAPSVRGYAFSDWNQSNNPVRSVDDINWVPSIKDEVRDGKIVSVTTHTATLNGSFTMRTGEEDQWALNYVLSPETYSTSDGKAWEVQNRPANAAPAPGMTKPVLGGEPTLAGHSFGGWKQNDAAVTDENLDWGAAVTSHRYDMGGDKFITVSTYTATVTGAFTIKDFEAQNYYTLTYAIEGAYTHPDGTALTPTKPTDVTNASAPPTVEAGKHLNGHTFVGWKQGNDLLTGDTPSYTQVGNTAYTVNANNQFVETKRFTAAVVGSYTPNDVAQESVYNLTYTGTPEDVEIAGSAWPDDQLNESTAPGVAARPSIQGYTFNGWDQGTNSGIGTIDWGVADVTYPYDAGSNTFTKISTYSVELTGAFVKHATIHKYVYTANYTLDGASAGSDTETFDALPTSGLPVIRANPTASDKVFSGWNPLSLNWGSVEFTDSAEVYNGTNWVITHTKTIDVTGSFTDIRYDNFYRYTLTLTGPDGVLPGGVDNELTKPGIPGDPTVPPGYRFDGWYQNGVKVTDSIDWGTPALVGEPVESEGGTVITKNYLSTATLEARFIATSEVYSYTLHYEIIGDPRPDTMPASVTDSSPVVPDQGNVPATIGEASFSGWSSPDWGEPTRNVILNEDGSETITYTYEATVTGTYKQIVGTREQTLYTVSYIDRPGDASPWPSDVSSPDKFATPTDLVPLRSGYNFTGWTLDDEGTRIERSVEKCTPELQATVSEEGGEGGEAVNDGGDCYIVVITTIHYRNYRANFTPTGGEVIPDPEVPLTPPTIPGETIEDEDVPLAEPTTGAASDLLVLFGAVLAIAALGLWMVMIVRQKRASK